MSRHYLDHASTSPIRPVAATRMADWFTSELGDPGRIHAEGMAARVPIEEAREHVATLLGARAREVVFTSSATEAIAAAVWGAAERGGHQVVSGVEHSAVRESAIGAAQLTVVPVDGLGRIDPADVIRAIQPGTALVHVQWGNHEVGTLQPVADVIAACREREVLVHVDAAAAAGHDHIDFRALGADLLTVSAHKLGAPPGAGALLVRRGVRLRALLRGGDQERARRAGFENGPAIVGFGAAAEALAAPVQTAESSSTQRHIEAVEQRRLTDRVLTAVPSGGLDDVVVYGDPMRRLPHIVCLGVLGIEPQAVLLGLDKAGIAAHSGSACSSEALEPSPVLDAMGVDAHRSLRISVGWSTTDADIDAFLDAFPAVLADLRALRTASRT